MHAAIKLQLITTEGNCCKQKRPSLTTLEGWQRRFGAKSDKKHNKHKNEVKASLFLAGIGAWTSECCHHCYIKRWDDLSCVPHHLTRQTRGRLSTSADIDSDINFRVNYMIWQANRFTLCQIYTSYASNDSPMEWNLISQQRQFVIQVDRIKSEYSNTVNKHGKDVLA